MQTVDCRELCHRDRCESIDWARWCHFACPPWHCERRSPAPKSDRSVNNAKWCEEISSPNPCPNNSVEGRTMIDEKSNQYCSPGRQNKEREIERMSVSESPMMWIDPFEFYWCMCLTILTSLIAEIVLIWIVIVTLHGSAIEQNDNERRERNLSHPNSLCCSTYGRIRLS